MLFSQTMSLSEVLKLGRFSPAMVQREFQWTTAEIARLFDDLLGAFDRIGDDPGEEEPAADTAAGAPAFNRDRQGAAPRPAGATSTAAADPADAALLDDTDDPPPVPPIRLAPKRIGRIDPPDCYFLGGLIFWNDGRSDMISVYDGLQRLTSITILLCALRDGWSAPAASDRATLESLLYADAGGSDAGRRVTFPSPGRTLAAFVNGIAPDKSDAPSPGDQRMRDAARYFDRRFEDGWPSARRAAFLAFIQRGVRLTVTTTDNHAVAYQMFVGANNRGLPLSVGDGLKGLMADRLRSNGGRVEDINACSRVWLTAQRGLGGSFKDFVHAVEVLLFQPDDDDRWSRFRLHTTGDRMQRYFDECASSTEIQQWVSVDFSTLARIQARSRAHNERTDLRGIDIAFRQLSFLGWTEWMPFYLALGLQHPGLGGKAFAQNLALLRRSCYFIELLEWSEGKRRKKFILAIDQLNAGHDPFQGRDPDKPRGHLYLDPFGTEARRISRILRSPFPIRERRATVVRWLETLRWGGELPASCSDDASVEHVLPVNAQSAWGDLFTAQERHEHTHRLGNLCLIDKKTNEEIGNKPWADKVVEYERWRGTFRGVEQVLRQSAETMRHGETRPWCVAAIEARTQNLATLAETALGIG